MSTVSNSTCTKCQNCGKFTNYAGDPHQKARMAEIDRIPKLERALQLAKNMMLANGLDLIHAIDVIDDALTNRREIGV